MTHTEEYHPRIFAGNKVLFERYSSNHPAIRALQIHAEACDVCVGREIEWPKLGNQAIEQEWFSDHRKQSQSFSSFAYEFISYDLLLDGWLQMTKQPTESEINFLEDDEPTMRILLDECESSAFAEDNKAVLPLIEKAREFLDAYRHALLHRFSLCEIAWPKSQEKECAAIVDNEVRESRVARKSTVDWNQLTQKEGVHPNIHIANLQLLLQFDLHHPVISALQAHAEALEMCLREMFDMPDAPDTSSNLSWFSSTLLEQLSFPAMVNEYVPHDLVLVGWLEMSPEVLESEIHHLEENDPLLRNLLSECKEAAIANENDEILPCIAALIKYLDAYKVALLLRFRECGIKWPVA
ncbi:MAG: hypothetical protein MI725_08885 [Pirellulales bacterium]|nr:hypothetical protein [Pirellulales bacterium]